MRKTGWIATVSGVILSIVLFLVQQTRWYAVQRAGEMSDFAQTIYSAFWATLIMTAFGVVLLIVTLRRRRQPEIERPAPLEITWICPYCGGRNTEGDEVCSTCGTPKYRPPALWICGWCGTENPETEAVCSFCHAPHDTPVQAWTCPHCGSQSPVTAEFCVICRAARPQAVPTWRCRACGSLNPENLTWCQVCKTPRAAETWACPTCGTRNPVKLDRCFVCRTGRPEGAAQPNWRNPE